MQNLQKRLPFLLENAVFLGKIAYKKEEKCKDSSKNLQKALDKHQELFYNHIILKQQSDKKMSSQWLAEINSFV